jgi:pimeloyl-ACP methyl ester carboxylesterase
MKDFVTSDHVRIAYDYEEKKQVIIYIHGWLQDSTIWKPIIKEFDSYGHLTVDLRGHGKSEEPIEEDEYELSRLTDDIQELIEKLDISNPILIGHSMGAMVSAELMTQIPVQHAVLIAGTVKTPSHINLKRAEKFLESLREERQAIKYVRNAHPRAAYACLKAIEHFNIEEQLRNNDTPTTIIIGENDAMTPVEYSKQLHKILANSQMYILPKAGHNTPITHTKQIIEIILKEL